MADPQDSEPRSEQLLRAAEAQAAKVAAIPVVKDYLDEAAGHGDPDVIVPPSGGPAGNARMTALLGLLILIGFGAQLLTTLNVNAVVVWHVAIGCALLVVVVAKLGTTSWKILRYYAGSPAYRREGPPPTILRVVGPLLMLASVLALGLGLRLILIGAEAGRTPLTTLFGQPITSVSLHSAAVWVLGLLLALHLIGRFVPMTHRVRRPFDAVPGGPARIVFLAGVVGLAIAAAVWGVGHLSGWSG